MFKKLKIDVPIPSSVYTVVIVYILWLCYFAFRNLTQKLLLLKKTEEAARQLESTKIHNQGG